MGHATPARQLGAAQIALARDTYALTPDVTSRSLFRSPESTIPMNTGGFGLFLPVFNTGYERVTPGWEGSIPSPRRSGACLLFRFTGRRGRGSRALGPRALLLGVIEGVRRNGGSHQGFCDRYRARFPALARSRSIAAMAMTCMSKVGLLQGLRTIPTSWPSTVTGAPYSGIASPSIRSVVSSRGVPAAAMA
jgi:hypothetical protein